MGEGQGKGSEKKAAAMVLAKLQLLPLVLLLLPPLRAQSYSVMPLLIAKPSSLGYMLPPLMHQIVILPPFLTHLAIRIFAATELRIFTATRRRKGRA